MLHIIDSATKVKRAIHNTPEDTRPAGVSPFQHSVKKQIAELKEYIDVLEDRLEMMEEKYNRLLELMAKQEKRR